MTIHIKGKYGNLEYKIAHNQLYLVKQGRLIPANVIVEKEYDLTVGQVNELK